MHISVKGRRLEKNSCGFAFGEKSIVNPMALLIEPVIIPPDTRKKIRSKSSLVMDSLPTILVKFSVFNVFNW